MTRLEMQVSDHDRPDPVAWVIRWWLGQILSFAPRPRAETGGADVLLARQRLPRHVIARLPPEDVFVTGASLPPAAPDAHRRALELRLESIVPVDPGALCLSARATGRASDQSMSYVIAMARADRLDALEAALAEKGGRDVRFTRDGDDAVTLTSARRRRRERRGLGLDVMLTVLAAVLIMFAAAMWTSRLQVEAEQVRMAERDLRRSAVMLAAVERQGGIASGQLEVQIIGRRAGVLLKDLSDISAATPDTAWWTAIRWTPQGATVAMRSQAALADIASTADAALGWRVAPIGPMTAPDAGQVQAYDLRFVRREAGTP